MKRRLCFALLCAPVTQAFAGEGNTLFNPTPDEALRPMATERPSKTDSPYSVDAGRFQIETNLYGYGYNRDCAEGSCAKTRRHTLGGGANLRVGLTDNADLQIIGDLYRDDVTDDDAASEKIRRQGYGDTWLRLKINAFGNNPSDRFSLGVLPYVKLPTNADDLGNNDVEGGVGLPFNVNFDGGWSVGGMTQFTLVSESGSNGYDPAYANSLVASKSVTETLSGYAEIYTYKAEQSGARWQNTADFGAVYAVTDNFRLDANVQLGVSDAADDAVGFFGTSYRF